MPIINITDPTKFYNIVHSPQKVLCLFYWKSCGYCREFAPVWNRVTNLYKDNMTTINVEAAVVNKLNGDDKIMLFPSVVVYQNGKKIAEFTKRRNEENLDKFIKMHFSQKPVKPKRKSIPKK